MCKIGTLILKLCTQAIHLTFVFNRESTNYCIRSFFFVFFLFFLLWYHWNGIVISVILTISKFVVRTFRKLPSSVVLCDLVMIVQITNLAFGRAFCTMILFSIIILHFMFYNSHFFWSHERQNFLHSANHFVQPSLFLFFFFFPFTILVIMSGMFLNVLE